MEENNQNELAGRFKSGDPAAFKEIFLLYNRMLFYFVSKLIGDDAEAEDIIAETFKKLWTRKEHLESIANVKAYLFITARNAGLDYLRFIKKQKASRQEFTGQAAEEDDVNIVNRIVQTELLEEVYREIAYLPERARMVFDMHYREGLTLVEIGKKLNTPPETIRTIKSRALAELRKTMTRKDLLPLMLTLYLIYF